MAKFMLLLGDVDRESAQKLGMSREQIMQKYRDWSQSLMTSGRYLLAHKLFDGEGRNVRRELTDGPFVETKETIGGFYLIEAQDYDEAVSIAQECPTVKYHGGRAEVRRVEI